MRSLGSRDTRTYPSAFFLGLRGSCASAKASFSRRCCCMIALISVDNDAPLFQQFFDAIYSFSIYTSPRFRVLPPHWSHG